MEPIQQNQESPQIIEDSYPVTPHRAPVFIILGALVIFVSTAVILFFNYQYTSKAADKNDNNFIQRLPNSIQQNTLSPTPTVTSQEESAVNTITIDDGSSDFSTLDQTASGL